MVQVLASSLRSDNNLDLAEFTSKSISVEKTSGGIEIFATRQIQPGSLILACKAVASVSSLGKNGATLEQELIKILATKGQQEKLDLKELWSSRLNFGGQDCTSIGLHEKVYS